MRVPPRLTASQLFWWSGGLIAGSFVCGWLVSLVASSISSMALASLVVHVQSLAYGLGIAGVAGSFVVRALEPRGSAPAQSPRNVDREQNV